jgi:hypothetical protein
MDLKRSRRAAVPEPPVLFARNRQLFIAPSNVKGWNIVALEQAVLLPMHAVFTIAPNQAGQRMGGQHRSRRSNRTIAEAHCWDEFFEAARFADASERGATFERLTQLYLQTAPEYRAALQDVWLLEEVPEPIAAAINLPRRG